MSATIQPQTAPIESAIRLALTEELAPLHLEVINESYMHNVPKGSETHFKVLVVSDKFEELSLIKVSINNFPYKHFSLTTHYFYFEITASSFGEFNCAREISW